MPPAPVTETSRCAATRDPSVASSSSRPISGDEAKGSARSVGVAKSFLGEATAGSFSIGATNR